MYSLRPGDPGFSPTTSLLDLIEKDLSVNRVYDYETIRGQVGCDIRKRNWIIRSVRRALEKRKDSPRSLINVPTIGYRIIHPNEVVGIAERRVGQARRQVREALGTVQSADLKLCDASERVEIERVRGCVHALSQVVRAHDRKLRFHERLLEDLGERVDVLEKCQRSLEKEVRMRERLRESP